MRLAPVGVIWMLAMMVLASGCNPASPLDTFKSLVDTEESALRSNYPAIPFLKFAFDVKKTDSLASPYLGTINIDTTWRQFPGVDERSAIYETDARISLYYAMQDGKWVYKNFEWVKNNWRVLKDFPDGVGKSVAFKMNKNAGIPTEIAEMKPELFWKTLNEIMSKTP